MVMLVDGGMCTSFLAHKLSHGLFKTLLRWRNGFPDCSGRNMVSEQNLFNFGNLSEMWAVEPLSPVFERERAFLSSQSTYIE